MSLDGAEVELEDDAEADDAGEEDDGEGVTRPSAA